MIFLFFILKSMIMKGKSKKFIIVLLTGIFFTSGFLFNVSCKNIEQVYPENTGGKEDIQKSGEGLTGDEERTQLTEEGAQEETSTGEDIEAIEQEQETDQDIFSGFEKLLLSETTIPKDLFGYIKQNIAQASTDTAAYMVEQLEKTQRRYVDIYTDMLFDPGISADERQVLIEEIIAGGFKMVQLEGSDYPFIDYSLLEKFSRYLPEIFKDYYGLMSEESDKIYLRDAAIVISWEKLAKRLIDAERYLKDYQEDDYKRATVANLYLGYLNSYIYGQNNTPAYDYLSGEIRPEVLESFETTVLDNPYTAVAEVIQIVLNILEEDAYVYSEDIFGEADELLSIPIKKYGLDSSNILYEWAKNIYYESDYSESGYVKLSEGIYTEKYDIESESVLSIKVSEYFVIGDLDRDGINDAALIITSSPGGSGTFYDLHVLSNRYFYIFDTSHFFLGDRVQPQNLSLENSIIYLNILTHGEDDPMCCPTEDVLKKFVTMEGTLYELFSGIGILVEYGQDRITVSIQEKTIKLDLNGQILMPGIEEGGLVYLEYISDQDSGTDILYYIEPASR